MSVYKEYVKQCIIHYEPHDHYDKNGLANDDMLYKFLVPQGLDVNSYISGYMEAMGDMEPFNNVSLENYDWNLHTDDDEDWRAWNTFFNEEAGHNLLGWCRQYIGNKVESSVREIHEVLEEQMPPLPKFKKV